MCGLATRGFLVFGLEEVSTWLVKAGMASLPFCELPFSSSCHREAETKAASPATLSSKVRRAAVGWGSTSRRRLFLRCSDCCSYESMAVMRDFSFPRHNSLGFLGMRFEEDKKHAQTPI